MRGWLLSTALALFLIDAIIVAVLGGGIAALLRRRAAPAMIVLALVLAGLMSFAPTPARADSAADEFAMKAVSQTRLAYVVTGTGPSGRLEEREVTVASEWPGGLLLVSAGLAPGERIIARAAAALVPGQTVAVGRTVGPAAP